MFSGVGTTNTGNAITQLADGQLDAIGFSGGLNTGLTISNTWLMSQTKGAFPVQTVNPDFSGGGQKTPSDLAGPGITQGAQFLSQSGSSADGLYVDSGYGTTTKGSLYASNLFAPLTPGWAFVDGGFTAQSLFPVV